MYHVIRYTAIGSIGLVSSAALFLISQFPYRSLFWSILPLWGVGLVSILWFLRRRYGIKTNCILLIATTVVAFTGLTLLIEWIFLRLFLVGSLGVILAFLGWWTLYGEASPIDVQKSVRRMMTMLWVFHAYALATVIFAIHILVQAVPFWILALLIAIFFGFISYMVWRLYINLPIRSLLFWVLLLIFFMIECVFVLELLPFGYLVLGLFLTWVWYILQLLFRFHLSRQGLSWRKQRKFLMVNSIAFVILFFVVRWI